MGVDSVYIGTDMVLRVSGVKNADDEVQSDATVTIDAIVTDAGEAVGGISPPLSADADPDTPGDYTVAITRDAEFVEDQEYRAEGTVALASGVELAFRHRFLGKYFVTPR